jgi:hypothetical protein
MNLLRSTDQDQHQQPNDKLQHFSSQEPCLSPPAITLMKTNISTSEEGHDYGEIEHYENDCLEKVVVDGSYHPSQTINFMHRNSH